MTVGIFVDGENLSNFTHFDWRDFKLWLSDGRDIAEAHYFNSTAMTEPTKKFHRHVRYSGFELWRRDPVYLNKLKKYKQAGVDVFMAIKSIELKDRFDDFILVSGDSDFQPLIEYMDANGKGVEIVSFAPMFSTVFKKYKCRFIEEFMEKVSHGQYHTL